jgi:hypothetical protein
MLLAHVVTASIRDQDDGEDCAEQNDHLRKSNGIGAVGLGFLRDDGAVICTLRLLSSRKQPELVVLTKRVCAPI